MHDYFVSDFDGRVLAPFLFLFNLGFLDAIGLQDSGWVFNDGFRLRLGLRNFRFLALLFLLLTGSSRTPITPGIIGGLLFRNGLGGW
jgi:hypothetical protein